LWTSVLAFLDHAAGGAGGGVRSSRGDVIEAGQAAAVGIDHDLVDEQLAVEDVLVHADGGDAVDRDHVVSAGDAGLPEAAVGVAFLGLGFLVFVVRARIVVFTGGIAGIDFLGTDGGGDGQQQAGEEVEQGGLFHRGKRLRRDGRFGECAKAISGKLRIEQ
jgi:hypothetical protein